MLRRVGNTQGLNWWRNTGSRVGDQARLFRNQELLVLAYKKTKDFEIPLRMI